ncbi:VOC family protein, partial [Candidatus Woesebacteria bacterium]|nr:VOC family protein [Candidatus Woesebacteria bacterium]
MSMTARFELFSEDTAKTIDFYTKILGFTKIKSNLERDHHELKRDSVQINIGSIYKLRGEHYFRPQIENDRKGLGVEIVLEVDDIHFLYKQVQESGYKIY